MQDTSHFRIALQLYIEGKTLPNMIDKISYGIPIGYKIKSHEWTYLERACVKQDTDTLLTRIYRENARHRKNQQLYNKCEVEK